MESQIRTLQREQMSNDINTFTANKNPLILRYPTLSITPVYSYNPAANPLGALSNALLYMIPYDQEMDFCLEKAEQRI